MKSIAEAISDLLFVRDIVVVPGLGAFVKKPTSAQVNRVANYFAAPSCDVEFDDDLREDNDLIINYIASENDIPEDEARRLLVMFVSDCFNSLKEGKKVTLKGIGSLRYDWHSDIVLEQDVTYNFNSDAFGLCDFTAAPVVYSATKDEIKAEIVQQQRDKNMPVTVDVKAVHEDEETPRRRIWPWVLLILLLLAGVVFGLQYLSIINFSDWLKPQDPVVLTVDTATEPKKPIEDTLPVVTDTMKEFNKDTVALPKADTLPPKDTVQAVVEQPVEEVEPIGQEANIIIAAACFSVEDYANKHVAKLKEQGYQSAFAESTGTKWLVAYGRYHTEGEAMEALRKIKAENAGSKAYIIKR